MQNNILFYPREMKGGKEVDWPESTNRKGTILLTVPIGLLYAKT